MTPDFRAKIQEALDALDRAFEALHESDSAVHDGTEPPRQLLDMQDRVYAAHIRAIDAALAANRAALELLRDAEE